MSLFNAIVKGDREVSAKIDQLDDRIREHIAARLLPIMVRLADAVRSKAPHKSGKLEGEIRSAVSSFPERVVGWVGLPRGLPRTEYGKAAALEYGSHREIEVRRPTRGGIAARLDAQRKRIEDMYERRTDVMERAYLRGPFASMREDIAAELQQAIDEATAEE